MALEPESGRSGERSPKGGMVPASRAAREGPKSVGRAEKSCAGGVRVSRTVLPLTLFLLLAGTASAQSREFSGEIREIEGHEMLLQNRRGDAIRFQRRQETRVSGEKGGSEGWGRLEVGDFVTVRWELADSPPVAYQVIVHSRGTEGEG